MFPTSLRIFIILGFLLNLSRSLRFDLQSGHTKCISEDIKSNSMAVGNYHIVNPNEGTPLPDSHKLTVRVTSAHGNNYHTADHVESGKFAYTAAESGDYMACFWTPEHNPPLTVTVDFDWKTGVTAKDWGSVVKKGTVDVMEIELKKLMDTVNSVHEEMFYLRDREEEMQALNRATNSRMFWLGLLSFVVCLSVAGLQFWHLKHFFERKKLL
ncbi:transmembrane emp24 domain-containing protein p24delta9-like [Amaranthus tricolor]|uniref:transmembrane emp24 domain-containing protein p24delta9-like n=1 Tax=Amaranthus tricolor TaxID=29722 RepID=UPI00258CD286|nr:transmembrane emp24 domain-containing protein p24delta9-like [Amaranthus tricolor]